MTYAAIDNWQPKENAKRSENLLDRWILSEMELLIKEVNGAMEEYELSRAMRAFTPFVDNLSNWYIRRSRKRFWKSEDDTDKEQAYETLYTVLLTLSKLMAPFTPFIAEEIYRGLTSEKSVHLTEYPVADESLIDEKLSHDMKQARFIVTMGLKVRADAKVKVRQPLQKVTARPLEEEMQSMILEELNVKEYVGKEELKELVELDLTITPELKLEGEAREVIRAIQEGRKKAGFNVEDRISLGYTGKEKVFAEFQDMIAKEILATEVKPSELVDADYTETVTLDSESFTFSLKRV
jgi:isoleucyl-tRNA synthetase